MFAVEMNNITKTFGDSFKANNSINFKVKKGEIHALVGENGAGKSTLMKILYGMYHPDEGSIVLNGERYEPDSPFAAILNGIGMVHQHFMLAGPLTVLENIILGDETVSNFGFIDYKKCKEKISHIAKNFSINVDLDSKVENLPIGIQQKIEILKVLYRNADILIFDEPTAVLTPQETDELFASFKELKSKGKTIIIITHKLNEVFSISDSITVLRNGEVTGSLDTAGTNPNELAALITGEEIALVANKEEIKSTEPVLRVENLSVADERGIKKVNDVSFEIKKGEIFGIAGVEGNGQNELAEVISSILEPLNGKILLDDKPLTRNSVISNIPADRLKDGVVTEFTVSENMILGRQNEKQFSSPLKLKSDYIDSFTKQLIKNFDIRPGNSKQKISGLSGGNQQKAVAARELTKDSSLILACHPTRGLDIKASNFLHSTLVNESKKGKAVLLISSELTELLSLCSRIAVMFKGEFIVILESKNTNENEIGMYMTGINQISNN